MEEYESIRLICQYLKEHNFQEALAALEKERLVFCACYYLYVKGEYGRGNETYLQNLFILKFQFMTIYIYV